MTSKSNPNFSSFEHLPELVTPSDSASESSTTSDDPQTPIDAIRQMTCSSAFRNEFTYMTVLDVYDEATAIGHDFERIIEAYGTATVRDLVPKVIRILEFLELQAAKNEKDATNFLEMTQRIERLESEKNETRELRKKFNTELESIEDQWRKETDNLMSVVARLEDENQQLRHDLHSENVSDVSNGAETIRITREELQCIQNLTDENIQLKRLLKTKAKELSQRTLDTEAVQGQLNRICKVNATLRQTNNFCANQTKRLMEERLELEVQMKEKENLIHQLRERIANGCANTDSPTTSTNDLTVLDDTEPRFSLDEVRQVLWERIDLKTKLMETEDELRLLKNPDDGSNGSAQGPVPFESNEKLDGKKSEPSKAFPFLKLCLLFPLILCFALISFWWRKLFTKTKSFSMETKTPRKLSKAGSVPNSTDHRPYSTLPSPSTPSTVAITQQDLPLLSPPASE